MIKIYKCIIYLFISYFENELDPSDIFALLSNDLKGLLFCKVFCDLFISVIFFGVGLIRFETFSSVSLFAMLGIRNFLELHLDLLFILIIFFLILNDKISILLFNLVIASLSIILYFQDLFISILIFIYFFNLKNK
jgi:hypothetical protein